MIPVITGQEIGEKLPKTVVFANEETNGTANVFVPTSHRRS